MNKPRHIHAKCIHRKYKLSCAEFDELIARAGNLCEVCKSSPGPAQNVLFIDHDHSIGVFAVRGLVCLRCNRALAHVDNGSAAPTEAERKYLLDPWHARRWALLEPNST